MAAGVFQPIRIWDLEAFRQGLLPSVYIQEAASLNVGAGTPVLYNSARQLVACGTTFQQASHITVDASANASSAGTLIQAILLTPEIIFEVTLNEAWALNLLGNTYGLVKDATTTYWYLSTSNTGNQMRIVGAPSTTAIGDTKSRVLARFVPTAIQGYTNPVNGLIPGVGADLASATTITPTNQVHHVTGTTAVATITVPAGLPDGYVFTIIPEGVFATTTAGNIGLISSATVVKRALTMTWDVTLGKWFPSYVS